MPEYFDLGLTTMQKESLVQASILETIHRIFRALEMVKGQAEEVVR